MLEIILLFECQRIQPQARKSCRYSTCVHHPLNCLSVELPSRKGNIPLHLSLKKKGLVFNSDLLSELEHFRRHHCSWAETHRVGCIPEGRSGEGLARLSDEGQQDLHGWEAFQEVNVLPPIAR